MSFDMHYRNPTFPGDEGPPVQIQARRSGIAQTGRLVVIDNPISYVVEPGRYYPFLSLRGHTDPTTEALGRQLQYGDLFGEDLPSNQEPHHVTPGYRRRMGILSLREGTRLPSIAPLADTTLSGTGPQQLPHPEPTEGFEFWSGLPPVPDFTRGI